MKKLIILHLFLPVMLLAQPSKDMIINRMIDAIKKTKGISYESVYTYYQTTPADTVQTWNNAAKYYFQMNEYDSLYSMNFVFEKREKSFNNDYFEQVVYNGQIFYSKEPVVNQKIPDPKFKQLDISNPHAISALDKIIKSQLPYIYKQITKLPKEKIRLLNDTIIGEQLIHQISFADDYNPFFELVVWVDSKTFLPAMVLNYSNVTKTPELMYTNGISNYIFDSEKKDNTQKFQVDRFLVDANQIDTESQITKFNKIAQRLPVGSVIPELNEVSVFGHPVTIGNKKNEVLLLYMGLIGCCPCIKSVPHLKRIYQNFYTSPDFRLIAYYPYDPPQILKKYALKEDLKYDICSGNKQTSDALGIRQFPDFVLINRSGKILKWYSYNENISDVLIKDIQKLLEK
ncbi:MAG: TlpA family protein disulfide reductase [Clostridiales bacterium]